MNRDALPFYSKTSPLLKSRKSFDPRLPARLTYRVRSARLDGIIILKKWSYTVVYATSLLSLSLPLPACRTCHGSLWNHTVHFLLCSLLIRVKVETKQSLGGGSSSEAPVNGSAGYGGGYGAAGRQTQRGPDARFMPYPAAGDQTG